MIERYLTRAELLRLISALLVVAGFLAIVAIFGFLVIPGMRNANQRTEDATVSASQGDMGWLDPTDYPAERGRTLPPLDPKTVMTPNAELLARGQTLFNQTCVSCHGSRGQGDGPAALGLNPKPRDFTQSFGWTNGPRIPEIYRILEEGIKGSGMVAYTYLSKKDRMALVHYVQTLESFPRRAEDPVAMASLAGLFAKSGEVIPNRIPVAKAMDKVAGEFRPPAPLAESPLLQEAILDPQRAAQALAAIPGWMESEVRLVNGVVAGIPGNGFRAEVATYGPDRWKALWLELQRMEKR